MFTFEVYLGLFITKNCLCMQHYLKTNWMSAWKDKSDT